METRASYTLVGAFVLALLAGLFVFVIWLARIQLTQSVQPYHIYFTGTVTGLVEGSPVRYRGVGVGTVRDIRIDTTNVERIRVTVEVPQETPIKADAVASLEPVGVTGGVYVELAGGSQQAPLLRDTMEGIPVIPSRPSSIAEVLEQVPRLVENLIKISVNVEKLLGPDNQRSFAAALASLAETSNGANQLISEVRGEVREVSSQTRRLLNSANTTMTAVGGNASAISEDLAKTASEMRKLTQSLTETSEQLGAMISENREPVRAFTSDGLYEFTALVTQLQDLVANLSRVTSRLERDPSELIFGGDEKGVKVK
jgi:phospholipid/cholesterol/gamma-HCH transport system substrate-binding protein